MPEHGQIPVRHSVVVLKGRGKVSEFFASYQSKVNTMFETGTITLFE